MSEALYRKYRPQIFEDVVGQEHIERTIKNAIESDKVSHAYLFTGPRGTGKTTTARLLAKALLCEKGPTPEPDGTCEDCQMIAAGEHPDVYELDAASRTGVENVREEIIGRVQFAPTRGRYKIYIIDEVHMLSTAAFNALLKTLEEPPSHVVFILATTDPQKVPETIHSRCQRFDFRRISNEAIVSRLGAICVAEGVEFEGEALDLVAHRAEGGMRNALTSLEQLIAFGEGRVTMEVAERMLGSLASSDLADIVRFIGTRDVAACFRWTAEFVETGADLAQFTRDLAEHVRNMYVMSLVGTDVALDVSEAARRELAQELDLFGPDRLARMLGVLGDLSAELKTSTNPRLSFEIALTRMVRPDSDLTLESLAERIEALESGYSAVAHVVSAPTQPARAGSADGSEAAAGFANGTSADYAGGVPAGAGVVGEGGGSVARDVRAPSAAPMAARGVGARRESAAHAGGAGTVAAQAEVRVAPTDGEAFAFGTSAAASPVVGSGRAMGAEHAAGAAPAADIANPSADAAAAGGAAQPAGGGASVTPLAGGMPAQLAASMQNPAALQRMWQAALAILKKAKAAYGVLFLNTKASFDAAASTLVIDFPSENDFAFRAVQKPDVQDELASALAQACGCAVPFRLTKGGEGSFASTASAQVTSSAAASLAASDDHAVPSASSVVSATASVGSAVPSAVSTSEAPRSRVVDGQGDRARVSADHAATAPSNVPISQAGASASSGIPQVDATSQATPPAPYETPTGYAGFDDAVPVDLYEDMVPYGDEESYYEPATSSAASAPASVPASGSAPASAQTLASAQTPVSASAPRSSGFSARSVASSAAGFSASPSASEAGVEPSISELDASLAFGFGEGLSFTEVSE